MPLHPQAVAALDEMRREGVASDHELTVQQARAKAEATTDDHIESVVVSRNLVVPGDPEVAVRRYRPAAPVGVVLYLHGGGHVMGTVDSYDAFSRRLANRVPATVVAVEYRRAPEHRCPAAVDDAEVAYRWVVQNAAALAPNSDARVVIAGDSAGGNNTAVLAQRLRDAHQPAPALQVLLYPPLDAVAYRAASYPSYTERGEGYGLTYPDGLWYWNHYLGPDGDAASPDASPLRADSLEGLPPAYLLTVEYDVLRDEGRHYADRLREAGVAVQHRHWDGHLHGFLVDQRYDDAERALIEITDAIRTALRSPAPANQDHRDR